MPDGVFVIIDYVGAPFLHRIARQREFCTKIWRQLPERLRVNVHGKVSEDIHIPSRNNLSPFEAIRSDAILPGLHEFFDVRKIFLYGGILFPLLNGFAIQL